MTNSVSVFLFYKVEPTRIFARIPRVSVTSPRGADSQPALKQVCVFTRARDSDPSLWQWSSRDLPFCSPSRRRQRGNCEGDFQGAATTSGFVCSSNEENGREESRPGRR